MDARTAILIPSLGREQHVNQVHGNIELNTPEPHVQHWMVGSQEYGDKLFLHMPKNLTYTFDTNDPDKRYVTRMNKLVKQVQSLNASLSFGSYNLPFVFFGSDDVIHHPFWLSRALDVMETAPNAAVVVVNDLRNQQGTQALVRSSYLPLAVFDDPTVAFHPGYLHNFADTEMFFTARMRGVCYRAMDSHVEHLHPLHNKNGPRTWDKTYADAQGNWQHDAALWGERQELIEEALS